MTETLGYPKNAKIWHQRLATFNSDYCRVTRDNVLEKYWGLEVILDQIWRGTADWERRIRQHGQQ